MASSESRQHATNMHSNVSVFPTGGLHRSERKRNALCEMFMLTDEVTECEDGG